MDNFTILTEASRISKGLARFKLFSCVADKAEERSNAIPSHSLEKPCWLFSLSSNSKCNLICCLCEDAQGRDESFLFHSSFRVEGSDQGVYLLLRPHWRRAAVYAHQLKEY